ncbi:MAG: glycosyltransferase family 39 protein [Candidatus Aureabacteria bacterium]|nr:glycosyltransferase family 39 protein [Candidatus Auribacterota bacterium]
MSFGDDRATRGGIYRIGFWCIVLLALTLRLWGIANQLPYKSYIEEDEFIYTALKYGSGDLNPHWFTNPPLYSYLLFTLYVIYYLAGKAVGIYANTDQYLFGYLTDPTPWYLIARSLSALLVIPTLMLICMITQRVFSRRCALAACAFFSVMPLPVCSAHYGCTEPLLMVFALLAALYAVRWRESGDMRFSTLAGVFTGLAAGTKYTGIFCAVILLAAHYEYWKPQVRVAFGKSILTGALAFLAVCPFLLLSPHEYFSTAGILLAPFRGGDFAWMKIPNLHLSLLLRYMPEGMGRAMAAAAVAGTIYLLLSRRRSTFLIAVLPMAFYFVAGFSHLFHGRYMLICYPFFAIAAAGVTEAVAMRIGRWPAAYFTLLCAALLLPSFCDSVNCVRDLMLPTTSVLSAQWIAGNLPEGSRMLVELVPVTRSEESIVREQRMKLTGPRSPYGYRKMTSHFFELQRRAVRGGKGFDVTRVLSPLGFYMEAGSKNYEEEWMTPEHMHDLIEDFSRYDYAVLSELRSLRFVEREKLPACLTFMNDFYREVMKRGKLLKVFRPEAGKSRGDTILIYELPGAMGKRR